jgi:hypothetical protein
VTRIDPTADRTCKVCGVAQPPEHFYASGHGNGRRTTCKRCMRAEQRKTATYHRHEKTNAVGDVWCPSCERWLRPDAFKAHPSRPGWWWQCRECQRDYDRTRYRAKAKTEAGRAVIRRRVEQKRAHARERNRARAEFVAGAIAVLRRRGFTVTEVGRLTGTENASIYRWMGKRAKVTAAVEARFAAALRATAHLPAVGDPPRYRRLPHPELEALRRRLAPVIDANPTRGLRRGA